MTPNSPTTPLSPPPPPAPTVPDTGRPEPMSAADFRALTARKPTAKGKTPPAPPQPRSAAAIDKEAAVRRAVVGVGRLAWTNTTFGVGMPCRKYLLADEGQAAELDSHFFRITGTEPT